MVVRIRFAQGHKIRKARGAVRRAAGAAGALLALPMVMALALAFWGLTAALDITSRFAIPDGFFSHWEAWLAAAVLLQLASWGLGRYAKGS
jgi:hypothetical protein